MTDQTAKYITYTLAGLPIIVYSDQGHNVD